MTETHLKIGETATFSKTITETDVVLFSGLTGDFDPIHVNEQYAKTTPFGRRIAHGGLVMWLLSTAALDDVAPLGRARAPTATSALLGCDKIRFIRPVFINDTLTARYTIEEIDIATARSRSKVEIVNQSDELCLIGTHVMKWVTAKT